MRHRGLPKEDRWALLALIPELGASRQQMLRRNLFELIFPIALVACLPQSLDDVPTSVPTMSQLDSGYPPPYPALSPLPTLTANPTGTLFPTPYPPTPSVPSSTDNIQATVTPTFVPITPEPTVTPLFRAAKIAFDDYGQHLTLWVGDSFVLYRFAEDERPLAIDNPSVLQVIDNPNITMVTLKAIGVGEARVSSLIIIPCTHVGPGCKPPMDYTYVIVNVVNQ